MQEAQESSSTPAERPLAEPRSKLGTVVVALIAVVGIVAGAIIFTMDTGAPDAPPTDNSGAPAATLSDEEAINRYLELEQLIVQAYETRDLNLIPQIYTPDSPTAEVARQELIDLRRDSVKLIARFDTESIEVVSSSPEEVVIRQQVVARGRIRPVGDVKVQSTWSEDQRQRVRILLREHDSRWLIHQAVVEESDRVSD